MSKTQNQTTITAYLEDSFPEDLHTDSDPSAVRQLLRFAKLGCFRFQLQQLSDWRFWHMAGELVNFLPECKI